METLTVALNNVLLGCFCLVILSWLLIAVNIFINDRKREKRDEEYHRKRMEEFNKQ